MFILTETINNIEGIKHKGPIYGALHIDLTGAIYYRGFTYSPDAMCFTYDNIHKAPGTNTVFSDYIQRESNTKTNIDTMFGAGTLIDSSLSFYTDSFGNVFTDTINEEYPEYMLNIVRHPKQKSSCANLTLVANPDRYKFKILDRKSTEGRKTVRAYNKKALEDMAIIQFIPDEVLERVFKELANKEVKNTLMHEIVKEFSQSSVEPVSIEIWKSRYLTPNKAKKVALQRMYIDLYKIYTHTVTIRRDNIYGTGAYTLTLKVERNIADEQ